MAYTIQQGDTLSGLAQINKTTVQELMKLNPTITDPNRIYAGASLTMPSYQTTPVTTQVDVNKLGNGTMPDIKPVAPQEQVNYGAITSSLNDKPVVTTPPTPIEQAQTQSTSWQDRITKLYGDLTGKSAYQNELIGSQDIVQKEKDVQNLSANLKQLKLESQKIENDYREQLKAQGISGGAINSSVQEQLKENSRQALSVSIALESAQGNLELANKQIDRMVDLKYKPLEDEVKAKEKQLELLDKYTLTPLETARKEEMLLKLEEQKAKNAEEKVRTTAFEKSIADAIANQMPLQTATKARELFNLGREDEARQLMAQYNKGSQESTAIQQANLDLARQRLEIAQEKAGSTEDDTEKKAIEDFGKALADAKNLTSTREQFINQLYAQFPQMEKAKIARVVYETYPDNYNK